MNDYNFDYLNYVTNIPQNMNYQQLPYNYKSNGNLNKFEPTNPGIGLARGNFFKNQYVSYNNYKAEELNPKNEREALLYQLLQYKFALIDLNLALDTNPNNIELLQLYSEYLNIEKQICDKYESMYGPLTLDSKVVAMDKWNWLQNSWPWEVL